MSSENPVLDFLVLLDRHRNGKAEELNRRNDELHCLNLVLDQIDRRLPGVVKAKKHTLRKGLTFQSLREALKDARQAPKCKELNYDVDVLPSQPDEVNVGAYMSLLEEEIEALDDQLWEHPLLVAAMWVRDKTGLLLEEVLDTAARYDGSAFGLAARNKRVRPATFEFTEKYRDEDTLILDVVPYAQEVTAEELRDLHHVPPRLRDLEYGELERHVCALFPWIRELEGYEPPKKPHHAEPPDALLARLTKQQRRMVEFVWNKPTVSRHKFEVHVWAGTNVPEKKSVERQVERLNDRLIELQELHSIQIDDEFVNFDHGSAT